MGVSLQTIKRVTIAQANKATPLSIIPIMVRSVHLEAGSTNTGVCYVGDITVNSIDGTEFGPGDSCELEGPLSPKGSEEFNLAGIFILSATVGNFVRVLAWITDNR